MTHDSASAQPRAPAHHVQRDSVVAIGSSSAGRMVVWLGDDQALLAKAVEVRAARCRFASVIIASKVHVPERKHPNIPQFSCLVRKEFLYNLEEHVGEFERAYAFGVRSVQCRAIGFHVALENGAVFWNLPIHALVHKPNAPAIPLDFLELWDCFGPNISVTQFTFLKELRCEVVLKDRRVVQGAYMFTIDWSATDPGEIDVTFSEDPAEHKCAHVVRLDCGLFAAQPNNRILWRQSSFIVKRDGGRPDYKLNTHKWICEHNPKWVTEDNDRYMYDYRHTDEGAGSPDAGAERSEPATPGSERGSPADEPR